MTRYRQEPRSYTYQSSEIRTRPKVVKRAKQIMVAQMSSEQKTIMVPKQIMVPKTITVPKSIQVPKTIFVDVTTTEQYSAPITKVGTRQVTVPYQVTVPAYRLANKCDQVTKIVKRQVPVFNVVAKQGPAPIQGLRYLSGEAIIDQQAAAPILAAHHHQAVGTVQTGVVDTGVAIGHHHHVDHHAHGGHLHISNSPDLNADGVVTGQEALAYSSGVRRLDAVHYGGYGGVGYGHHHHATGLVVRNDTTDLDGDGVTTANEAARYVGGERRVDLVGGGGGHIVGGYQGGASGAVGGVVDLNGDGVVTQAEAAVQGVNLQKA